MKKPRQFTPDDLNHGEPIYFVSRSNPIPMPIENNNSNEWGYYFPNKMEAEKWVRENKRVGDPIQRIKYLKERNEELMKEIAYDYPFQGPHYHEWSKNRKELKEEESKYFRNFMLLVANDLRIPQFINWLANKIDKLAK